MDLATYHAEIDGIEKYEYTYFYGRKGDLHFNPEELQFRGQGFLSVEERKPFAITFNMTDAAGNSDTQTLLMQLPPDATPIPHHKVHPLSEQLPVPESDTITVTGSTPTPYPSAAEESTSVAPTTDDSGIGSEAKQVFHMEEETIPILIGGVSTVLAVCLVIMIMILIKSRNKGYFLFIAQLIFVVFGFMHVINDNNSCSCRIPPPSFKNTIHTFPCFAFCSTSSNNQWGI